MIDNQKIEDYLINICDFTKEEIEKYKLIIERENKSVCDNVINVEDINDERIIAFVGSRINYYVALSKTSSDNVTSFSAGDIRITESNGYLKNLKDMVDLNYKDCACLLNDDGFAFLGV